ncbi:MAG: TetR/AcrR family transcriptional regulator [Dehalococcoidia bacterium]|nr:TetR/AcrR family transcriptional regulator [Dehalococcoidia bacterium]
MKTKSVSRVSRAIQERKKRENDQRLINIYEAAKKVFFEKGYLQATMEDICVEAQVSKPTIYRYFKSKDALYCSLMIPITNYMNTQLANIEKNLLASYYKTGKSFVQDMFRAYWGMYNVDPEAFIILLLFQQTRMVWKLDEDTRSLLLKESKYSFVTGRKVWKLAMKAGLVKQTNVYHLVDIMWASFFGIVQLTAIKRRDRDIDSRIKDILGTMEGLYIGLICS